MDEKPKRGDFQWNDQRNVGAIILIVIGVLFLLGSFGIIGGIIRLWPLLLIGLGVWIFMGKGKSAELKHEHYSATVDQAKTARMKLSLPVGETTVSATSDANTLIDADMHFLGEMQFSAQGDGEKLVNLSPVSGSWTEWMNPKNWNWDRRHELRSEIRLNQTVPIDLDIDGGVGESRIDLSTVKLSALDISGGVGQVDVTLPASSTPLEARVQVGVGEVDLTIPSGAALNARIKGGVGATHVTLPVDAAVRVDARAGIGDVSVSSRLQRVSGSDEGFSLGKSGVWETPGFATAERKINITYEGGVGELKVR